MQTVAVTPHYGSDTLLEPLVSVSGLDNEYFRMKRSGFFNRRLDRIILRLAGMCTFDVQRKACRGRRIHSRDLHTVRLVMCSASLPRVDASIEQTCLLLSCDALCTVGRGGCIYPEAEGAQSSSSQITAGSLLPALISSPPFSLYLASFSGIRSFS